MSSNIALRNKSLDDHAANIGTGTLTFYSGAVPASADAALSGNTALVSHTLAGFVAASNGSMTANAVADATVAASGTASFVRIVSGSYVEQLTVGTSGAQVIVPTTTLTQNGNSTITSITVTRGA